MASIDLSDSGSGNDIPIYALEAIQSDALLPICTACGTQYPFPREDCPICVDPRQYVPSSGQTWTSLAELSSKHKHILETDEEDDRIQYIKTEPAFAINQTPILLRTSHGCYIWDCSAFLSLPLINYLSNLSPPLKGIAISHPHFFATSLTWARALRVPLYLSEDDKSWYRRLDQITETDDVRWWIGEAAMCPGLRLIQCGGHFPGSSVLHWDRLEELPPSTDNLPTKPTPVSGLLLTADTIMVQPTQKGFAFIWSVPNLIPLRPKDVLSIQNKLQYIPFAQATSSWPNRFIRRDAKEVLEESVVRHLAAMGWRVDQWGDLVELVT